MLYVGTMTYYELYFLVQLNLIKWCFTMITFLYSKEGIFVRTLVFNTTEIYIHWKFGADVLLKKDSCTHHNLFLFWYQKVFCKEWLNMVYQAKLCFCKYLFRFEYECFLERELNWHKINIQIWIYLKQNNYSENVNLCIRLPIIFV